MEEFPKEIIIQGIKYEIQEVPVVSKLEPLKGQIKFLESVILIDESMNLDLKYQTLLHEVIHAICDLTGNYDIGENEKAVQSIASALYCLLVENNLLSFLRSSLR